MILAINWLIPGELISEALRVFSGACEAIPALPKGGTPRCRSFTRAKVYLKFDRKTLTQVVVKTSKVLHGEFV